MNVRRQALAAIFAAAGLASASGVRAAPQAVTLAVVQEVRPDGDGAQAGVRLLFRRTVEGWTPVCGAGGLDFDCPRNAADTPLDWYVYGPQSSRASLSTHGWVDASRSAFKGLLALTSGPPPWSGGRSSMFAGWLGGTAHRPMAATDRPLTYAVSRWRPAARDRKDLTRVWPAFREAVPRIDTCDATEAGERAPRMADLAEGAVYQGDDGERLVEIRVKPGVSRACVGPLERPSDLWLRLSPAGDAVVLDGQIGALDGSPSLKLLAFGDFAGDGDEEALFSLSAYDRDGFVLYYDDFRRRAAFSWAYH
jgi:hypothetical protein